MKVILKFNLPEEKEELKLAQKGADYFSVLWDICQKTRSYLRHGHNFKDPDEVLEWLQEQITVICYDD